MSTPGNGGWVQLPRAVLLDRGLSAAAVRLYGVLQTHWWQGGECWASHQVLAGEMGVSLRHLRRYLGELLSQGHIIARPHGHGQAKAYSPTGQICPVREPQQDNDVALEPQQDKSVPLEGAQRDRSVRPNGTPVSAINRKREVDTPEITTTPDIATPDPPTPQTGEVAEVKAKAPKVTFRDLSEDARIVVDDWRKKQGRLKPPDLNPALAKALEDAVVDLGVVRLCEQNTWAAETQIPELIKVIRGARTRRKREEEGVSRNGTSNTPRPPHAPWRPSTVSEEHRQAARNWRSKS